MIRHVFVASFKEGLSDAEKLAHIAAMAGLKDNIPQVAALNIGLSNGLAGPAGKIVMTEDFATLADFEAYMHAPYHIEYIGGLCGKNCDSTSFVSVQFEI